MPELPEVETVRKVLNRKVKGKRILSVNVYWENIIVSPSLKEFLSNIKNQVIKNVGRYGKWLMFELDDYYLLSHLRMEGKYSVCDYNEPKLKHQHVIFHLEDNVDLRYSDTRKFGKMYLLDKNNIYKVKPLKDLGLEPWDKLLTIDYLRKKFHNKPIKTELLDQSIIAGIGNIYADEILFKSKINPKMGATNLTDKDCQNIIENTKIILSDAIVYGGTTVKSYTSEEGVHGKYQEHLSVHTKNNCPNCKAKIKKITVGGRGTYYCENCQKERVV